MIPKTAKLLELLERDLEALCLTSDCPLIMGEAAVTIVLRSLEELKALVINKGFINMEEEICFFKEMKPQFTSKLIFYNKIYKIESQKPFGGCQTIKDYYNSELLKLKQIFDSEIEFCTYYRTGSTYLDHKYFVRGGFDIKLALDSYNFESDFSFATAHSYKIAQILACRDLQDYLENRLSVLSNYQLLPKAEGEPKVRQIWTAPKAALIELLYALKSEGVFNNGASDLKDIAMYFEQVFHIDLGQYHRTFSEIKLRKTDRTKFINKLSSSLTNMMEESDYFHKHL